MGAHNIKKKTKQNKYPTNQSLHFINYQNKFDYLFKLFFHIINCFHFPIFILTRQSSLITLPNSFLEHSANSGANQKMVRGSSQSQAPSGSTSRPGVVAPRGSAAATAGMRRRRLGGGSSSGGGSDGVGGSSSSNMLRFYTDDAPGFKISPTVVLVMSLCFIGFVTALHVFGKLYRYRSAPGA